MSALERLEQYAREGQHAERLALATRTLELHPSSADALHHRVLALLELRGFEGALAALHEASEPLLARGETLPPALLETYRALAQRAAMVQRTPKAGGEILEVSPCPDARLVPRALRVRLRRADERHDPRAPLRGVGRCERESGALSVPKGRAVTRFAARAVWRGRRLLGDDWSVDTMTTWRASAFDDLARQPLRGLSQTAKLVWLALRVQGESVQASNVMMANLLGVSEKAVSTALEDLTALGLLEILDRGGGKRPRTVRAVPPSS